LTKVIYQEKMLENSYPFKNSLEGSKLWAIEILIRGVWCKWQKDALK